MASRRAAVSIAQLAAPSSRAAIPTRIRATTQLSLRQYHNRAQQLQPLVAGIRQSRTPCARQCATAKARGYSTKAETKAKILDFEAMQKLITNPESSVTIIDVREPHELQQTGRIPSALNIPITTSPDSFHISEEEFEDRFGFPRPPRNAEVVFYCRSGVRSHGAAGLAKDAGWTEVGEYPGSWMEWFEKGGKVAR